MSNKYKKLAPTISTLMTKTEVKAKKNKIFNEQTGIINSYEPMLTKEAVELAIDYIRWMGASSIPWEYKEYYNNGPQDISIKICKKLGYRAITEEQVRVLYSEWKTLEVNDLEDPVEETPSVTIGSVDESVITPETIREEIKAANSSKKNTLN